jgi:hypothetical protein
VLKIDLNEALSIPWFTVRFMALPVPRRYDNLHIATVDSFIMHVSRHRPRGNVASYSLKVSALLIDPISSYLRWGREPKAFELGVCAQRQQGDLCRPPQAPWGIPVGGRTNTGTGTVSMVCVLLAFLSTHQSILTCAVTTSRYGRHQASRVRQVHFISSGVKPHLRPTKGHSRHV